MRSVSPYKGSLSFEYKFQANEVAAMAKFLRSMAGNVPDELLNFTRSIEDAVYDALSIEEAECFYS